MQEEYFSLAILLKGILFMAVILSGVPNIGSKLEIIYSGNRSNIALYSIFSGISKNDLRLIYVGESPFYTPSSSDRFLQAKVLLKDNTEEESLIISVIENAVNTYEESKIFVVGNGLSLSNVLSSNVISSKIVSDVKRISQSIFIILSTSLAEIPMLDTLGSTLPYHLFREVTAENINTLRNTIIETLSMQEPRISVIDVEILYDGEYTLACTIVYTITNSNIKSSYIYNVSVGD